MLKAMILFAAVTSASAAEPVQSSASYEAAIRNSGSSPSYVMVTIVDANTHVARTTCTTSNLFLGALHLQYGLAYDAEGGRQATELALSNTAHRFTFSSEVALRNVPDIFSPEDLDAVRKKLAPLSADELHDMFPADRLGKLHELYDIPGLGGRRLKNVVACALIERGFSPHMQDRSGALSIGKLNEIR